MNESNTWSLRAGVTCDSNIHATIVKLGFTEPPLFFLANKLTAKEVNRAHVLAGSTSRASQTFLYNLPRVPFAIIFIFRGPMKSRNALGKQKPRH